MQKHLPKILLFTFLSIALSGCSGTRPANLGEINQTLQPCPDKPNCVSSMAPQNDQTHFIEPLSIHNQDAPLEPVEKELERRPEANIIVSSEDYLYAEFTSDLMGFVDDVEFMVSSEQSIIHVRSASRLGYKDFDANRDRIESIRQTIEQN